MFVCGTLGTYDFSDRTLVTYQKSSPSKGSWDDPPEMLRDF
jgi:hypothetical protein